MRAKTSNQGRPTSRALVAAIALVAGTFASACSGAPGSAPATTIASIKPAITEPPAATLDPTAQLVVAVETDAFRPSFRIKLPSTWFHIERDAAAFQAWLNDERYELTIDSTYKTQETVKDALARLKKAPGLNPGGTTSLKVGGRDALTFVAENAGAVKFADSGFHTNEAGKIRVVAVSIPDGTTVSLFVTTTDQARFADLDQIVSRILESLEWTAR